MHRIEVKVKGKNSYKLNYSRTFIEKTLPTRVGDRVISGLAFDLKDNPLGIEAQAGEPGAGLRRAGGPLPVEIRVPIDKVALIPDGDDLVGWLMAYYAARDTRGSSPTCSAPSTRSASRPAPTTSRRSSTSRSPRTCCSIPAPTASRWASGTSSPTRPGTPSRDGPCTRS